MRTGNLAAWTPAITSYVGMKPLSERDENKVKATFTSGTQILVGMKPLSERDENQKK